MKTNRPIRIEEILAATGRKMMTDFQSISGQVFHRPSKGSMREDSVASYLRMWLPKTVRVVVSATIVSTNGLQSPQCDIVVCDAVTPLLLDDNSHSVIPIECVYGVVQVKSHLDSNALAEDYAVIRKIKNMPKVAFRKPISPVELFTNVYGDHDNFFPVWSMIFAFTSIRQPILHRKLVALDTETPERERTDLITCLDAGFVTNIVEDGVVSAWATDGNLFRGAIATDNPLAQMTIWAQAVMNEAWMNPFQLAFYFDGYAWGTYLNPEPE